VLFALPVELVEGIGGEFLRPPGVADQAEQCPHQTGIMFDEKIFENPVAARPARSDRRTEAQERLFTGVHIY
jgi:hypothetical protein